jgi:hypothetical protein
MLGLLPSDKLAGIGRKRSWPISLFHIGVYLGSWEEQRNSFREGWATFPSPSKISQTSKTSKFWAPEGCKEASFVLRTDILGVTVKKKYSSGRPDAWDLYTSALGIIGTGCPGENPKQEIG